MMKILNDGKCITVTLEGNLDGRTVRELQVELDGIISRSHPEILIFDFKNVKFMDDSGLRLILGRYRVLRMYGGELRIRNVNSEISAIIMISGLGCLLDWSNQSP